MSPRSDPKDSSSAAGTASLALPFAAMLVAAFAMATSPFFVRGADVGPFASGFWRVAGALPVLWLWAAWEAARADDPPRAVFRIDGPTLLTGLFFAGDILVWHLAILNTTVANATLFANLSPVWVIAGSWLLIGEKAGRASLLGLVICIAGAMAILGSSYSFAPDRLVGDFYGIATSMFFGAYFLAVRVARRRSGTGRIIFQSSAITAVVLLIVALAVEGRIMPLGIEGVLALIALAYFSHAGGQGLLTYALGHLPPVFSSLVSLLASVIAAALAWIFLAESMSAIQIAGGALVLCGIYIARPARVRP